MSLRIKLSVLLVIALSGFAIYGCADASISDFFDNMGVGAINSLEKARVSLNLNNIPPLYDPYWDDLGPTMIKENSWNLVGTVVPTNVARTFVDNGLPTSWYDPFWDDLGPALIKDSVGVLFKGLQKGAEAAATIESSNKIANTYKSSKNVLNLFQGEKSLAFAYVSVINVGAKSATSKIFENAPKVYKLAEIADKTVSETQKMSQAAKLAQQGLGSPQLSPYSGTSVVSSQNKEGIDAKETSGTSYTNNAMGDPWYIDIDFEGFRNLLWKDYNPNRDFSLKPPAPKYLPSGELNTYGYNFIAQPGMAGLFDPAFIQWVEEYLASIGQSGPSAGYGLLIDEGQDGEGGW